MPYLTIAATLRRYLLLPLGSAAFLGVYASILAASGAAMQLSMPLVGAAHCPLLPFCSSAVSYWFASWLVESTACDSAYPPVDSKDANWCQVQINVKSILLTL